jgi:nucleoside 2-deoxyribosyltransferase
MIEKIGTLEGLALATNIMRSPIWVYVAHPYGGKEENKSACAECVKQLQEYFPVSTFFSGIHTFSLFPYEDEKFEIGIDRCLELLDKCKAIVLCGGWRNSKGCCAEYGYAKAKGIQVFELEEP